MAGIQLTEQRRSQLLEQLLSQQQQRPQRVQSFPELAAKLGAQLIRSKKVKKLRQAEADQQKALIEALNTGDVSGLNVAQRTEIAQLRKLQSEANPSPKAPTTRTIKVGKEFVTQEFVNGKWEEVSRASRRTESIVDTVEGFNTKTDPQLGKNVVDFEDAAIGATGAFQTGKELLELAQLTPEAIGKPGAVFRFGADMKALGVGLGKMFGVDVGPDRNIGEFDFSGFSGNLDKVARESSKFRSGIYGIAFATAVAEQGTRPTDKDIQQFIDQIAGNSSSFPAFSGTIEKFMARVNRRLITTADIKGIPKKDKERIFGPVNEAFAEFNSFFSNKDRDRLKAMGVIE